MTGSDYDDYDWDLLHECRDATAMTLVEHIIDGLKNNNFCVDDYVLKVIKHYEELSEEIEKRS